MAGAWRNLRKKNSRPLFTIIFRPEMLKFHPYSILTGQTMVRFVMYCVLKQLFAFFQICSHEKLLLKISDLEFFQIYLVHSFNTFCVTRLYQSPFLLLNQFFQQKIMAVLNAPAARDYPVEYKRPRTIFHTLSAAKWYFVTKIVLTYHNG